MADTQRPYWRAHAMGDPKYYRHAAALPEHGNDLLCFEFPQPRQRPLTFFEYEELSVSSEAISQLPRTIYTTAPPSRPDPVWMRDYYFRRQNTSSTAAQQPRTPTDTNSSTNMAPLTPSEILLRRLQEMPEPPTSAALMIHRPSAIAAANRAATMGSLSAGPGPAIIHRPALRPIKLPNASLDQAFEFLTRCLPTGIDLESLPACFVEIQLITPGGRLIQPTNTTKVTVRMRLPHLLEIIQVYLEEYCTLHPRGYGQGLLVTSVELELFANDTYSSIPTLSGTPLGLSEGGKSAEYVSWDDQMVSYWDLYRTVIMSQVNRSNGEPSGPILKVRTIKKYADWDGPADVETIAGHEFNMAWSYKSNSTDSKGKGKGKEVEYGGVLSEAPMHTANNNRDESSNVATHHIDNSLPAVVFPHSTLRQAALPPNLIDEAIIFASPANVNKNTAQENHHNSRHESENFASSSAANNNNAFETEHFRTTSVYEDFGSNSTVNKMAAQLLKRGYDLNITPQELDLGVMLAKATLNGGVESFRDSPYVQQAAQVVIPGLNQVWVAKYGMPNPEEQNWAHFQGLKQDPESQEFIQQNVINFNNVPTRPEMRAPGPCDFNAPMVPFEEIDIKELRYAIFPPTAEILKFREEFEKARSFAEDDEDMFLYGKLIPIIQPRDKSRFFPGLGGLHKDRQSALEGIRDNATARDDTRRASGQSTSIETLSHSHGTTQQNPFGGSSLQAPARDYTPTPIGLQAPFYQHSFEQRMTRGGSARLVTSGRYPGNLGPSGHGPNAPGDGFSGQLNTQGHMQQQARNNEDTSDVILGPYVFGPDGKLDVSASGIQRPTASNAGRRRPVNRDDPSSFQPNVEHTIENLLHNQQYGGSSSSAQANQYQNAQMNNGPQVFNPLPTISFDCLPTMPDPHQFNDMRGVVPSQGYMNSEMPSYTTNPGRAYNYSSSYNESQNTSNVGNGYNMQNFNPYNHRGPGAQQVDMYSQVANAFNNNAHVMTDPGRGASTQVAGAGPGLLQQYNQRSRGPSRDRRSLHPLPSAFRKGLGGTGMGAGGGAQSNASVLRADTPSFSPSPQVAKSTLKSGLNLNPSASFVPGGGMGMGMQAAEQEQGVMNMGMNTGMGAGAETSAAPAPYTAFFPALQTLLSYQGNAPASTPTTTRADYRAKRSTQPASANANLRRTDADQQQHDKTKWAQAEAARAARTQAEAVEKGYASDKAVADDKGEEDAEEEGEEDDIFHKSGSPAEESEGGGHMDSSFLEDGF